jgi:hypothetical protein
MIRRQVSPAVFLVACLIAMLPGPLLAYEKAGRNLMLDFERPPPDHETLGLYVGGAVIAFVSAHAMALLLTPPRLWWRMVVSLSAWLAAAGVAAVAAGIGIAAVTDYDIAPENVALITSVVTVVLAAGVVQAWRRTWSSSD